MLYIAELHHSIPKDWLDVDLEKLCRCLLEVGRHLNWFVFDFDATHSGECSDLNKLLENLAASAQGVRITLDRLETFHGVIHQIENLWIAGFKDPEVPFLKSVPVDEIMAEADIVVEIFDFSEFRVITRYQDALRPFLREYAHVKIITNE